MGGLLARLRAEGQVAVPVTEVAPRVESTPGASARREAGVNLTSLLGAFQEEVLTRHPELIHPVSGNPLHRQRLATFIQGYLTRHNVAGEAHQRDRLTETLVAELTGFGPLEKFLADPDITEIMINGPGSIFIERSGLLEATDTVFRDSEHLMQLIQRIIAPLGRRLDASQPYVDARLPDGSRLHAIIDPIALDGPVVTIRRFAAERMTTEDLVALGSLSEAMVECLAAAVARGDNILVSGGTSSGKTTMLNALSAFIPGGERIVTIEEAAELSLAQSHVVRLEARPPNAEGRGEVTVRTLVRNALRMRPDRIVIGEVRGLEAFDLLQAMNTGHRGSLCTVHANSCTDALTRFENMVLMAPEQLPHSVIREQVRSAVDLVLHQGRLADGRRLVTEIAAMSPNGGQRQLQPLFRYDPDRGFVQTVSGRVLARAGDYV